MKPLLPIKTMESYELGKRIGRGNYGSCRPPWGAPWRRSPRAASVANLVGPGPLGPRFLVFVFSLLPAPSGPMGRVQTERSKNLGPVGGGAGTFFLWICKMSAAKQFATARDEVEQVRFFHLYTPPPARPHDYTPHDGRNLTVLGRARDTVLLRPEPAQRATPSRSKPAGAAARARSRGWRVRAPFGGSR